MSVYNIRYMQLTTISRSISYSPSLQHQCNVGPIDDADAGCSLIHERYDDVDDSDDDDVDDDDSDDYVDEEEDNDIHINIRIVYYIYLSVITRTSYTP